VCDCRRAARLSNGRFADRDQIVQVLTNLVQNALDALDSTGGEVNVSIGEEGRIAFA
jgi:signal transduction histidine kinase